MAEQKSENVLIGRVDWDKVQKAYSAKVIKDGLVFPRAAISEIRRTCRTCGVVHSGYELIDTSGSAPGGNQWYGYKYEIRKDGEVILKSREVWRNRRFRVGFDQTETEDLICKIRESEKSATYTKADRPKEDDGYMGSDREDEICR
jgi:hypothetical protein